MNYSERKKKLEVYLDMDNVLADFDAGVGRKDYEWNPPEMFKRGFFLNLPVMAYAKVFYAYLERIPNVEVYIATKYTAHAPDCLTEKLLWVQEHFPKLADRMMVVCDKGHLNGDVLVDDDHERWQHCFRGTFMHFDHTNPKDSFIAIAHQIKCQAQLKEDLEKAEYLGISPHMSGEEK